jgi:hypothetical protein
MTTIRRRNIQLTVHDSTMQYHCNLPAHFHQSSLLIIVLHSTFHGTIIFGIFLSVFPSHFISTSLLFGFSKSTRIWFFKIYGVLSGSFRIQHHSTFPTLLDHWYSTALSFSAFFFRFFLRVLLFLNLFPPSKIHTVLLAPSAQYHCNFD